MDAWRSGVDEPLLGTTCPSGPTASRATLHQARFWPALPGGQFEGRERKSARWDGGKEGSSTWSRKKRFRVRDAQCCHPCLHSPGSAIPSSRSGGRSPGTTSSQEGTSVQPSATSSLRAAEAVRRQAGPRASVRQRTAQSEKAGHREFAEHNEGIGAGPVSRRAGARGLRQSQPAKAGREEGDVPSEACLILCGGAQTSLQGAPYGCIMMHHVWLARGAAQKLRRSHAHCRSGSLGSWRSSASSVFRRPRHGRTLACLWGCPERRSHVAAGGQLPRQTSVPYSAIPGGGGPPSWLKTRVLPKLADMPACVSTSRVTKSKAARARDGSGRRT